MTRYLFDTNHAGSLLNERSALWERIGNRTDAEFSLCRPSIAELWYMVLNSARATENREKLEILISRFVLWEFDAPASIEYGQIRVELRRSGKPIPAIDAMIGAIARKNDLTVLSSDRHFQVVERLRIENWLI